VHFRAVSFRVLVHAEMEAYIEEVASSLFQDAWACWSNRGTPSRVVIGLLAFSGRQHSLPSSSLKDPPGGLDVQECVQKAQAVWREAHRRNHGLKEENLLRLLLPLGIPASGLDSTLVSDLSSFGAARGEAAHTSATRVTQYVDPESELKRAKQLAIDLGKLDTLITEAREEVARVDSSLAPASAATSAANTAQLAVPVHPLPVRPTARASVMAEE
jgi:hypothetical protein